MITKEQAEEKAKAYMEKDGFRKFCVVDAVLTEAKKYKPSSWMVVFDTMDELSPDGKPLKAFIFVDCESGDAYAGQIL